jgi:hypothetical protein
MEKLRAEAGFAPLAGRLAVGAHAEITPAMLADASMATARERQAISRWAEARAECIRTESRYGNATYRAPLQTYALDAENKLMAAIVELHDGKISYGEFNRVRQAIADEKRAKSADLSRRMDAQRAGQEQADRQAREREQARQAIEEAEWQASMARQRAEQALQSVPPPARRPQEARRDWVAPRVPNRGCFRFGSRIACTGW